MNKLCGLLCIATVVLGGTVVSWCAAEALSFDAPKLDGIVIDGNPDDWGTRGLRIELLASANGEVAPRTDFDAGFRLGWNENGLFVLVAVTDDVPCEGAELIEYYANDVVILTVAVEPRPSRSYVVVIFPGLDLDNPDRAAVIVDLEDMTRSPQLSVETARMKVAGGYRVEAFLPWSNLGVTASIGNEIGFQVWVNDSDGPDDGFAVRWNPLATTPHDTDHLQRVRLAQGASFPVLARGRILNLVPEGINLKVVGVPSLADKRVQVKVAGKQVAAGRFSEQGGRPVSTITVPLSIDEHVRDTVELFSEGRRIGTLSLAEALRGRAEAIMASNIRFSPYVFSGGTFPTCDFEDPARARELLGAYQIRVSFYDSRYNPVDTPREPGRYGAVVDVTPSFGRPLRRFETLFRLPKEIDWWSDKLRVSITIPEESGARPDALKENEKAISNYLIQLVRDHFVEGPESAALLAGLYEAEALGREATVAEDVWAADRQWWVGWKRQQCQIANRPLTHFSRPVHIEGEPAPTLRFGTVAEAAMDADSVERIDEVCREWAANSDEAFVVCLARHGVIFFHRAYGICNGAPMTVDTKSWMASLTKLLAGTMATMAIDQGLIRLDDPVERFLPPLAGVATEKPLTIHHLYTHTHGLPDPPGDNDRYDDLEERVADFYPCAAVGDRFRYGSIGLALGGKVLEAVSGTALPQLYKRHLLDPLGCTHTDVTDSAGRARSTAWDMAKIGQMLLNRGRCGAWSFFREETFEQILPKPLTNLLGPDTKAIYGLGTTFIPVPGLSERTFGHGAASGAILCIDPDNGLVISMTRNSGGENYQEYRGKFLSAVVQCMPDNKSAGGSR